jgi:hypothetical protein
MPEIRAAQKDIESNLLAIQPAVEKTAVELAKTNPKLATRYLTDYSIMHAELTVSRWRALFEHLVMKYNDGYVRNQGKSSDVGYPEAWLREVVRQQPDRFRIPTGKPPDKVSAEHGTGWATAIFDHTSYDFGVVPRGAKLEHRFVVKNICNEEVEIQSVSSSCGCSTPKMDRRHLKRSEKAEILVTVDTRGSLGPKNSTIKVALMKPSAAEVQLQLHAYVRSDVSIEPGVVQFGVVNQGTTAERNLMLSHAGGQGWRIQRVECANPHIAVSVAEISHTPSSVSYRLSAKLRNDAPPGYIQDQLVLITNDPDVKASRVPIAIEGLVAAALSASPLWMGVADPGQPVTRNLVVQGKTPFRILAIRSSDARFQCKMPAEAKNVHIVPVTFLANNAGVAGGHVAAKIRIETDLTGAQPIETPVSVQVAPAEKRRGEK